jgi:hypothetical protein
MGMFTRMPVGRSIAAANMTAGKTKPQVYPLAPDLQTIFAALQSMRFDLADLIEVCAFRARGRRGATAYCFSFHNKPPLLTNMNHATPTRVVRNDVRQNIDLDIINRYSIEPCNFPQKKSSLVNK